jgi:DNA-binding CsgD family transcriptional regulator
MIRRGRPILAGSRRAIDAAGQEGGMADERVLSPRQRECLSRIAGGQTTNEIAAALGLSPRTVDNYVQHTFARLGVRSRAQAVARAMELQILVSPGPTAEIAAGLRGSE